MHKVAALLFSIYITILIYTNAFFIQTLTLVDDAGQLFWNHLAIFLIILIPVFLLVSKYVSAPYSRGSMKHVRSAVLTVALVGLFIAVLYHVVPIDSVFRLPTQLDPLFASDTAYTLWLILPLLALFI